MVTYRLKEASKVATSLKFPLQNEEENTVEAFTLIHLD